MMASGRLRRGFFASSPAVATPSRPMKEKKITPAAAVMPENPNGVKWLRFAESQPVTPITMNMMSTAILIATMTALVFADSLAPRINSSAHITTSSTAGRLNTPPCSGAFASASGIWKPNRLSSSWLTYSDHPTATAAAATPHSSSRHAPTQSAVSSPRVA